MSDLEKIFPSKETADFSVKTGVTGDHLLDNNLNSSFEKIFQSQFTLDEMANHGKDLPTVDAESDSILHRKLPGGAELYLAGNEPSDASLLDYARAQGIDPEVMALLMSDAGEDIAAEDQIIDQATKLSDKEIDPNLRTPQTFHIEEGRAVEDQIKDQGMSLSSGQIGANPLGIFNQSRTENITLQYSDYSSMTRKSDGHLTLAQTLIASQQIRTPEQLTSIATSVKTPTILKAFNPISVKSSIKLEAIQLGDQLEGIFELKDGKQSNHSVQSQAIPVRQDTSTISIQALTQEVRSEFSNKPISQAQFSEANTELARRQEQYLDVSRRLTQAVGERLTAQIARGAWRVEMDIHPKSLGRIEIQLEMRNGELEAHFNSSQNTTRELLQESFSKLKDILAEHGIDSAYIGLGTGTNRNSDGKPTDDQHSLFTEANDKDELLPVDEIGSHSEGLDVKV